MAPCKTIRTVRTTESPSALISPSGCLPRGDLTVPRELRGRVTPSVISAVVEKVTPVHQVLPRFELGSLDSKSRVLTITPWDHGIRVLPRRLQALRAAAGVRPDPAPIAGPNGVRFARPRIRVPPGASRGAPAALLLNRDARPSP